MKTTISRVLGAALLIGLMMTVAGCGKATKEGKTNAYKESRDKLQALGTKDAKLKVGITAKLAEFDKEFKEAETKEGEAGVKAISALVTRMNKYHATLSPKAAAKTGKTATDPAAKAKTEAEAKLKAAKAAAEKAVVEAKAKAAKLAAPPVAAPGGKLGGTAPPTKVAPPAPAPKPANSGFGGK
ncbi:MAG: hypothetical protein ACI9OJ_003655 [Myxococcota bacterium]|jgi:hypothetical protein